MRFVRVLSACVFTILLALPAFAQVNYATQIQPIFDGHCIGCHGSATSGVTLASYAEVMASVGSQYGTKVVIAGNGTASPLYDKVANAAPQKGFRMPRGGPALSDAQILLIKNWIDQGALASPPTGVARKTASVADEYALSQNYPNPFNPATKFNFSIPTAQFVTITIFDITGRVVDTPVKRSMEAGTYTIEWNGVGLPSGLYFYQFRAGGALAATAFTATKKLILQK